MADYRSLRGDLQRKQQEMQEKLRQKQLNTKQAAPSASSSASAVKPKLIDPSTIEFDPSIIAKYTAYETITVPKALQHQPKAKKPAQQAPKPKTNAAPKKQKETFNDFFKSDKTAKFVELHVRVRFYNFMLQLLTHSFIYFIF